MYSETADILAKVKTRADLLLTMAEMDALEQGLYRIGDKSYDEVLKNSVRSEIAGIISKQNTSEDIKKDMLREIKNALRELITVKITLAIDPPRGLIDYIYDCLKQEIKSGFVIELEREPAILAGMRITYKGKYGDFSLLKKWDTIWREQAGELERRLTTHG